MGLLQKIKNNKGIQYYINTLKNYRKRFIIIWALSFLSLSYLLSFPKHIFTFLLELPVDYAGEEFPLTINFTFDYFNIFLIFLLTALIISNYIIFLRAEIWYKPFIMRQDMPFFLALMFYVTFLFFSALEFSAPSLEHFFLKAVIFLVFLLVSGVHAYQNLYYSKFRDPYIQNPIRLTE